MSYFQSYASEFVFKTIPEAPEANVHFESVSKVSGAYNSFSITRTMIATQITIMKSAIKARIFTVLAVEAGLAALPFFSPFALVKAKMDMIKENMPVPQVNTHPILFRIRETKANVYSPEYVSPL